MCTESVLSPDSSYYENWPGPNPIQFRDYVFTGTEPRITDEGSVPETRVWYIFE